MPVNGRARIDPNFSSAKVPYFGNVYVYALAELQMDHFSGAENVLTDLIPKICDAIAASNSADKINAGNIAGLCSLVSRFEHFPALFPAWSISSGRDLAITSWANLGIYEMRFGDILGHPEFVRLPYTALDSAAIILPRKRSGVNQKKQEQVIEVIVMLREYDLRTLQEDELWREVACN